MSDGQPRPGLLDTDVLRAFRRGDPDALQFISAQAALGRHNVSQLSAMILVADAADAAERTGLGRFFSWCDVRTVTARTTRRALDILLSLPPPCGLTADDAVVAATAIEHNLPLYTLDTARFATVPGLTTLRPY